MAVHGDGGAGRGGWAHTWSMHTLSSQKVGSRPLRILKCSAKRKRASHLTVASSYLRAAAVAVFEGDEGVRGESWY